MAALSVDGTPMPALPNSADQINYDNTTSGLSATTVKGAVDELASEKQDKTDNSLQTTDKTIPGAINELKSGLTNYQAQNDLNLEVPDRKNVLRNIANSATTSGVLYTVNNDGSVSASTETQSSGISSLSINDFILPAGEYVLNGCPSGGSSNTYELQIAIGGATYRDYGDGVAFTSTNQRCVVQILIRSGVTINDTFYPMIRPATITDPTFAPYIPSVESRIEAVESNNFGTVVDLSAYQQGDKYTCLSDGYAVAYVPANGNVTYRLYGASGSEFIYNSIEASNEQTSVIYVKKGMRLELRAISGTSASFKFYPFAS